jgi:hypothetical protein
MLEGRAGRAGGACSGGAGSGHAGGVGERQGERGEGAAAGRSTPRPTGQAPHRNGAGGGGAGGYRTREGRRQGRKGRRRRAAGRSQPGGGGGARAPHGSNGARGRGGREGTSTRRGRQRGRAGQPPRRATRGGAALSGGAERIASHAEGDRHSRRQRGELTRHCYFHQLHHKCGAATSAGRPTTTSPREAWRPPHRHTQGVGHPCPPQPRGAAQRSGAQRRRPQALLRAPHGPRRQGVHARGGLWGRQGRPPRQSPRMQAPRPREAPRQAQCSPPRQPTAPQRRAAAMRHGRRAR